MGWWKKMFKESVGDSEVREHESYDAVINEPKENEAEAEKYSDVEIKSYTHNIYEGDLDALEEKGEPAVVIITPIEPVKQIKSLDLMKVRFERAANQSKRNDVVRGIILHHIMMGGFRKNVDFLVSKQSGVSAHYILGRNAELTQTVNSSKKAWHSGVSRYSVDGKMRTNLNNCMIGIEIVNPGYVEKEDDGKFYYNCGGKIVEWKGDDPVSSTIVYPNGNALSGYSVPYPEKQLNKLAALCKALVEKYPAITRDNILTHYQAAQPSGRKNDPFGLDVEKLKNMIFG